MTGFKTRLVPRMQAGQILSFIVDVHCPGGERRRWTLGTADRTEATRRYEKWLTDVFPKLQRDWQPEPAVPDGDARLSEVIEHYVRVYLPNKNAASKTVAKCDQVLFDFLQFCRLRHIGRMSQVAPRLIDEWAAALRAGGRAPKTVANYLGTVRAAFRAGVDREIIRESPIRKWLMPQCPEPEISPLTAEQLGRVLNTIREVRPALYPIIRWIALTGNRPSDAIALTWAQVDLKSGTVARVQIKTKQLANYELSQAAVDALRGEQARPWYEGRGVVFRDAWGQPWTVNRVYRDFTRGLAKAGFERSVTLKDLRHTFGSIMANEVGCPLPVLRRLMGHTQIETTMKYVRGGDARPMLDAFAEGIGVNAVDQSKPLKTKKLVASKGQE